MERLANQYTTKVFEKTNTSPFWNESRTQSLRSNKESAIVVVIDYEELKDNVISKMEFNGVLIYNMSENECVLPTDEVHFSSWDTMGEQFDVMSGDLIDNNIVLAVLATSVKTDLILRHIKKSQELCVTFDMFCKYLKMEYILGFDNIVIHRLSPYHVLNSLMIVSNSDRKESAGLLAITVYSRSPSQVLALLHFIYDAVPYTIIITTPSVKITAKDSTLSTYNENTEGEDEHVTNYMTYAKSMLNRTGLVLEYLDNCLIHMSESKNSVVQNKIGSEIDLFAQGEASYKEFKEKMRQEAVKGVEMLAGDVVLNSISDVIC